MLKKKKRKNRTMKFNELSSKSLNIIYMIRISTMHNPLYCLRKKERKKSTKHNKLNQIND